MAVGDIERAAERFMQRGLGLSKVAQRRIQQLGLEQFQRLSSALRTPSESAVRMRRENLLRRVSREGLGTMRAPAAPVFDPNAPQAIVVGESAVERQPVPGVTRQPFGITTRVGGTGQMQTERFESFDQLQVRVQELQQQGVQVVLPGVQRIQTNELEQLQRMGVFQRTDIATQRSFLGRGRRTVGGQTAAIRQAARLAAPPRAPVTERPTDPIQVVKQGLTPTRGEQARVVESALARVLAPDFQDLDTKNLFLAGLRVGKGFEMAKEMIRLGGLV